ncbi:hypothetical protein [Litorivivens sp.]|uniref:hypothetical protein n=1 Tax=Litorivivens sp. TaxID=2020868 RepID=UPI00356A34AB
MSLTKDEAAILERAAQFIESEAGIHQSTGGLLIAGKLNALADGVRDIKNAHSCAHGVDYASLKINNEDVA